MAYFTVAEARAAGRSRAARESSTPESILRKSATAPTWEPFGVFLSHSSSDAEAILGIRAILERAGRSVYVDWINDPQLDRSRVSAATAQRLRDRMNHCASLVYVATKAATTSKWMPWEFGYFDGRKTDEAVAILPLVDYAGQDVGQEYLDLYPKIENGGIMGLAPIVTRDVGSRTETKSVGDLVLARGGPAWRS
jgi:hypothetical protein